MRCNRNVHPTWKTGVQAVLWLVATPRQMGRTRRFHEVRPGRLRRTMRTLMCLVLLVFACSSTKSDSAPAPAEETSKALDEAVAVFRDASPSDLGGLPAPLTKREWRKCSEGNECTHVWNCRDSGTAVNRRFEKQAEAASEFGCRYSAMNTPKMATSCNEGICESKPLPELESPDQMDLDDAIESARRAHREQGPSN